MDTIFLLHILISFFMCGLIWIIQLVHYPAFRFVDDKQFVQFESFHTRNISLIVVPLMLCELISAVLLVQYPIMSSRLISLNLIIILAIWIVTFVFSVPCHKSLTKAKDLRSIRILVNTNWLRTFLWTAKAFLLLFLGLEYFIND